jgi:pentose-5-phosphate-3-epimerase
MPQLEIVLHSSARTRLGSRSKEAGGADRIEWTMDGRFVQHHLWPAGSKRRRCVSLPIEAHGDRRPERYVADFASANRRCHHYPPGSCAAPAGWLSKFASWAKGGVAQPVTPAATLEDILGDVDHVLVMTVSRLVAKAIGTAQDDAREADDERRGRP